MVVFVKLLHLGSSVLFRSLGIYKQSISILIPYHSEVLFTIFDHWVLCLADYLHFKGVKRKF